MEKKKLIITLAILAYMTGVAWLAYTKGYENGLVSTGHVNYTNYHKETAPELTILKEIENICAEKGGTFNNFIGVYSGQVFSCKKGEETYFFDFTKNVFNSTDSKIEYTEKTL